MDYKEIGCRGTMVGGLIDPGPISLGRVNATCAYLILNRLFRSSERRMNELTVLL